MSRKSKKRSIERSKTSDDTRSRVSKSHAKSRHSNRWSTIIDKRWRAQVTTRARRTINVRRKKKEKWTNNKKWRVFIFWESDKWGDAKRLARNVRAKSQEATLELKARKSVSFTKTNIILYRLINQFIRISSILKSDDEDIQLDVTFYLAYLTFR